MPESSDTKQLLQENSQTVQYCCKGDNLRGHTAVSLSSSADSIVVPFKKRFCCVLEDNIENGTEYYTEEANEISLKLEEIPELSPPSRNSMLIHLVYSEGKIISFFSKFILV